MNHAIKRHAQKVGLPASGGIHTFPRDVARELATLAVEIRSQRGAFRAERKVRSPRPHDETIRLALEFDPSLQGHLDLYSSQTAKLNDPKVPTAFGRNSLKQIRRVRNSTLILGTSKRLLLEELDNLAVTIQAVISRSNDHAKAQRYRERGARKSDSPPTAAQPLAAQKELNEKESARSKINQRLARSLQQQSDIELLQLPVDATEGRPTAHLSELDSSHVYRPCAPIRRFRQLATEESSSHPF
ncbi:unnamed protein product [Sympodiomycopsis kandeliae]